MKDSQIKIQIELAAKEAGVSEIVIIQQMQSELAKKGDEKGITALHKIKMSYVKAN